jgi:hypothetical protein
VVGAALPQVPNIEEPRHEDFFESSAADSEQMRASQIKLASFVEGYRKTKKAALALKVFFSSQKELMSFFSSFGFERLGSLLQFAGKNETGQSSRDRFVFSRWNSRNYKKKSH